MQNRITKFQRYEICPDDILDYFYNSAQMGLGPRSNTFIRHGTQWKEWICKNDSWLGKRGKIYYNPANFASCLIRKKCVVPAKFVSLLCSSSLYDFIIDRLNNIIVHWSHSLCDKNDGRFLECLTNDGYLNYRSSSLDSFKVMISSKDPFYEVWFLYDLK